MSDWKTIVGLEVHAELLTESKMFSACPVVDSVEAPPNTATDPLSLGMPGTLPVINAQAVEYGMMVGLALNCAIPPFNQFARKSYFYPDLPKGYQISQYEYPLAVDGYVDIELSSGETKRIRVRRAHLEEDTGKLTHMGDGSSLVDYNRAGVPLLEIVSEPDIFSAEEAEVYARKLRALLQYLGVNHGDMSKGVLRFEANVSVMHRSDGEYRMRREIKNLNSIRSMVRAIEKEAAWQIKTYESGGTVKPATLGWDEDAQTIIVQRYKERPDEYRYFPDPDLPAVAVSREWVDEVRAKMPELPDAKRARYLREFGLSAYDASLLVTEPEVGHYYEAVLAAGADAKAAANWILNNVFTKLNEAELPREAIAGVPVKPDMLAELIQIIQSGGINSSTAVKVLETMWTSGERAVVIVEREGLAQINDPAAIAALVDRVIAENERMVSDYLGGKEKLFGGLVGKVMGEARGKANPQLLKDILQDRLNALKG
jgi:aspartyl-tRNA(Asn)/glutamyl-tRNA(Gln) amidotransferase subunit B